MREGYILNEVSVTRAKNPGEFGIEVVLTLPWKVSSMIHYRIKTNNWALVMQIRIMLIAEVA